MRYFFAFLATVGLIIIVIVLLLSGGGGGGNKTAKVAPKKQLVDYANTNAIVSLRTEGVISANSTHEQIKLSVDRDQTKFEHIKGYSGNVVLSQTSANTTNAYSAFLNALQKAGFTNGAKEKINMAGYCALGNRFIYEITQDGQTVQSYWSSTCGSPSTYLGDVSRTQSLFKLQFPDYRTLMQDVSLQRVQNKVVIKAIIFDCFGVLTADTWREFVATLPEAKRREASELNRQYGAAYLSKSDFLSALKSLTGMLPQDIDELLGHEITKNDALLEYIATLNKTYKIGLLSNVGNNWIRSNFLNAEEQLLFDEYILSYEVRVAKPDPQIFELAAERLGVKTSECIMVDDVEYFCGIADSLGMKSVIYHDFVQTKAQIDELLAADSKSQLLVQLTSSFDLRTSQSECISESRTRYDNYNIVIAYLNGHRYFELIMNILLDALHF